MTSRPVPDDERQVTLDASLLGRDYKFACRESERVELIEAVAFLDRRMRDIREAGKVAGSERIAVMAALNLAHEMQRAKREHAAALESVMSAPAAAPAAPAVSFDAEQARRRIVAMHVAIDKVLAGADRVS